MYSLVFDYSCLHGLLDWTMIHAGDCALAIEKATEASLNLVIQSVALASGVIKDEDYVIDFETLSGTHIQMGHQGKIFGLK